ncbi:small hydrophobic protein [Almendravirus chico]|uniref:small hydrophobic protein n=1 Tax=Almendravirus chico TaxID=1972687 RepID=UPI001E281B11|nr:small hydrophobic protein [Almendravirus chico]
MDVISVILWTIADIILFAIFIIILFFYKNHRKDETETTVPYKRHPTTSSYY